MLSGSQRRLSWLDLLYGLLSPLRLAPPPMLRDICDVLALLLKLIFRIIVEVDLRTRSSLLVLWGAPGNGNWYRLPMSAVNNSSRIRSPREGVKMYSLELTIERDFDRWRFIAVEARRELVPSPLVFLSMT